MTLLFLGLFLWYAAHLFKRLAPGPRAKLGTAGKGIVAVGVLAGLVLMVLGYRAAPFENVWFPPGWTVHLNNLLMLFVIMLFGMGGSKGRMRSWFRHPMLMGTALWAISHLIVNGDVASIILFGGILIWAVLEIRLINRAEPNWTAPEPGPAKGDVKLVVISLVLYVIIALIHGWIGPSPFG
ncbi:putative membrane protein [Rubricella aquisinus]|uniref:Putative membrane protein n=1 Tax=Rubricella aquisinus TaxID=2028108 RepID=A0A840WQP2_9RHOB|nr:NnrU family protein [Rubricella aquisinus]MBB5517041.1 putative membrane protein [Rubricella aquisinus]